MTAPSLPAPGLVSDRPDWGACLASDPALSPGLREGDRVSVSRFLSFCSGRGQPPSIPLAREHVELMRLEHAPSPARLQQWKDALNWYFRRGRNAGTSGFHDVPPLARADLGQTAWERALVRVGG